jgi:hypothetical protein
MHHLEQLSNQRIIYLFIDDLQLSIKRCRYCRVFIYTRFIMNREHNYFAEVETNPSEILLRATKLDAGHFLSTRPDPSGA